MKDGLYSIDGDVYAAPAPALVARIVDSHGLDAACERWHWLGERSISTLAQKGRAQGGDVAPRRTGGRPMACPEIDAAVAVEAGFVLGSASRGIRAAGITVSYQGLHSRRGLTPPMISPVERGIASSLAGAARRGDAEAAEAWEARLGFEHAVGSVVRKALALVPEQPAAGRYALPPVDAVLAEALRDENAEAVAAVFPGLAALVPAEPEAPAIVIATPTIPETRAMPRQRRMPTDDVIIAERAQGRTAAQMAADWEVSIATVYAHWRRLDAAALAAQVEAVAPEPLPAPRPEPIFRPAAPAPPPGDLSVEDLARAVALAQRAEITPGEAIEFVRADVDQARARPVAPDLPPAGFSAPRLSPALTQWFEALNAGDPLPELEMADFHV